MTEISGECKWVQEEYAQADTGRIEIFVNGIPYCEAVFEREKFVARNQDGTNLFWTESSPGVLSIRSFMLGLFGSTRFLSPLGVVCELRPRKWLWLDCAASGRACKLAVAVQAGRVVYTCDIFKCSVGTALWRPAVFMVYRDEDVNVGVACALHFWLTNLSSTTLTP